MLGPASAGQGPIGRRGVAAREGIAGRASLRRRGAAARRRGPDGGWDQLLRYGRPLWGREVGTKPRRDVEGNRRSLLRCDQGAVECGRYGGPGGRSAGGL